jgi:hypothetical protein
MILNSPSPFFVKRPRDILVTILFFVSRGIRAEYTRMTKSVVEIWFMGISMGPVQLQMSLYSQNIESEITKKTKDVTNNERMTDGHQYGACIETVGLLQI